ncbi:19718_t:CDS:2 [Gigaspora margarita]|uniref:19718_t:CDS:1 n=1 Tax=Gigaspora margarita TaxID=4874 RepID=A0ABN7UT85_GIGMA|nr:19718_t:CDS:2 [Gigaspora margarita]
MVLYQALKIHLDTNIYETTSTNMTQRKKDKMAIYIAKETASANITNTTAPSQAMPQIDLFKINFNIRA